MHWMSAFYEAHAPRPWSLDLLDEKSASMMLRVIKVYRMRIDHWEAKDKLSQNKSASARADIVEALMSSETPYKNRPLARVMAE